MPKYTVLVEGKAKKQFKKMPKDQQTRILSTLTTLPEGLSNKLDIKKLQGYQYHYRIRVGKLVRVRFELNADRTIIVYSIFTREKAYR